MPKNRFSAGVSRYVLTPAVALLAIGGLAVATVALAQAGAPPAHERPTFSDLDTNKDGTISPAEFDAFKPPVGGPDHGGPEGPASDDRMPPPPPGGPRPDLADLDTNKDAKVSLDEFLALPKAHFAKRDANHDGVLDASEMPKPPLRGDGPPPVKETSSK